MQQSFGRLFHIIHGRQSGCFRRNTAPLHPSHVLQECRLQKHGHHNVRRHLPHYSNCSQRRKSPRFWDFGGVIQRVIVAPEAEWHTSVDRHAQSWHSSAGNAGLKRNELQLPRAHVPLTVWCLAEGNHEDVKPSAATWQYRKGASSKNAIMFSCVRCGKLDRNIPLHIGRFSLFNADRVVNVACLPHTGLPPHWFRGYGNHFIIV